MRSLLATGGTVVALLVVSAALLFGVTLLTAAVGPTGETPAERTLAAGEADRLVSDHGPVAVRAHVLSAGALEALAADNLGVARDTAAVTVRVNDTTLVQTGPTEEGTTVERIVLLRSSEPRMERNETVVVPAGATNVTITAFDGHLTVDETPLAARDDTAVPVSVTVSQSAPTQITAAGNVTVRYDEPRYEPTVLSVTVARGEFQ